MSNTYYARRGNKILKIGEDYIERYLGQGYSITDANGNLIKKGIPHDTNALTAEVRKQDEEIAGLKKEIDAQKATIKNLTDENADLKAQLKKAKTEIDNLKSSTPISEPKTTTRKRKQSTESDTEKAE